MDLKGIISITGMNGLYKVVAQAKNGFIVEALHDKKRHPISATQRISALEDISVYLNDEDLPLSKVLVRMKEQNETHPPIDSKADNQKLFDYFSKILPTFDKDRVYASDIKKILTWYSILKDQISTSPAEVSEEGGDEKKAIKVKKDKLEGGAKTAVRTKEGKTGGKKATTVIKKKA